MRIAFAGSPEAALPTLDWLASSDHTLVRVLTQPDKPAGRGKVLTPTPVGAWAMNHGVETVKAARADELAPFLQDIDCVVTVGYGLLLPQAVLDIPKHGFINLHFSLLPHWRGAAPVQRAIENGDEVTGITIFQLDAGMDTGPFYLMQRYALDLDITSDELLTELALMGPDAVSEVLSHIEKGIRPTPQTGTGVSHAAKLKKSEGEIQWSKNADHISAHIRAFTSNPGAWTTFNGSVIKIEGPNVADFALAPGTLDGRKDGLYVGTSTQALKIAYVTPQGKSKMNTADWVRGARLQEGDRFGS